jgi:mannose-6-phosphate isomerase-like protein (cupin superfamily)
MNSHEQALPMVLSRAAHGGVARRYAMSGYVVPPGDGRSFGPGINVKVEHGASPDFAVFESVVPPLWPGPGLHLHRSYDEGVYVLDGTIVFTLDGVEHICPAGSFVFVPRGCNHGFANRSVDPARILPVTTPGAIRLVEELFHLERVGQAGVPADLDHSEVDPAAVAALFAKYDSELLAE